MDLGSIPNWIEAIATTGALLGTAILLRIEGARRRNEKEAKLQAQAAAISHWLERPRSEMLAIRISNSSPSPIYFATFRLLLDDAEVGTRQVAVIPPGNGQASDELNDWLAMFRTRIGEDTRIGLDMFFVDASGHQWVRNLNGRLTHVSKPVLQ